MFLNDIAEFRNVNIKGGFIKRFGKTFFRKNHTRRIKATLNNYPISRHLLPKLAQRKRYLPDVEGFSKSEIKLMVDYLTDGYERFSHNSYYRSHLDKTINDGISFILKKLPKPDIKPSTKFTRYLRVPEEEVESVIGHYLVGPNVTFNGKPRKYSIDGEMLQLPRYLNDNGVLKLYSPMSFSKSAKHAKFFKNKNSNGRALIKYEVKPKKNTRSRDVELFKEHSYIDEGEMLFPKNTKFKVTDVSEMYDYKKDEPYYTVKLKEI